MHACTHIHRRGLVEIAPLALKRRGLAAPTSDELEAVEAAASEDFERNRRLSLLEPLLGELLEARLGNCLYSTCTNARARADTHRGRE